LRINSRRFEEDFNALAQIGATPQGGVHRPALSESHLQARAWFRERVLQAGLEFRQDAAGNHSAYLACGPEDAPTLLLGSHLDSVPQGGRFDGALGVLAALEVLRSIQEAALALPVNLEAIDFTDEEGALVGLLGSRALGGKLRVEELEKPRGGREVLLAGLERAGLSESGLMQATRKEDSLAGYLELHIEQGPRLLNSRVEIGVVTTIVGICSYRLIFSGRADHAGTMPMDSRLDASLGAAGFTLAARRIVLESFPDCVVNVGEMVLEPGAFNIVPSQANLALEFRSPEEKTLNRLEIALMASAQEEARRFGLGLEIESLSRHQPTPMSATAGRAIIAAAEELGLKHIPLASGAGHDAQSLADLCPAGMIFVPSQEGASHSAREFTQWEDCLNGANVLLGAALRLAESL